MIENGAPVDDHSDLSDTSFRSKKIQMIFKSQERLDVFANALLKPHHLSVYNESRNDPKKSASHYIQKFLTNALGLDLIDADSTSKCVSLEVSIIQNEIKLGLKKVNDSMCVMLFQNKDSDEFSQAITSQLNQSIFVEFPEEVVSDPLVHDGTNLLIRHAKGSGPHESKFCLAVLNSLTFTHVDGDALQTPDEILSALFDDRVDYIKYALVKNEDYHLVGFDQNIASRWHRLLSGQKSLLRGLKGRVMPYTPFGTIRAKFHEWVDKHCEALRSMETPTPHKSVQTSFNRIVHLHRIGGIMSRERGGNTRISYKDISAYDLFTNQQTNKWQELHQKMCETYRSNGRRNISNFSGTNKLQRKDGGFASYCGFEEWNPLDKKSLIYNLNPKFWNTFHMLNLAHLKWTKYKQDAQVTNRDEERALELTNVSEFDEHYSWILIMKEFKQFVYSGGCLS